MFHYQHVRVLGDTATTSVSSVRHSTGSVQIIKFVLVNETRTIQMGVKASTVSDFVAKRYDEGLGSPGVYFAISELCPSFLPEFITSSGVADEDDFWRWASQLIRAVVDIHRAGITHGAVLVREE